MKNKKVEGSLAVPSKRTEKTLNYDEVNALNLASNELGEKAMLGKLRPLGKKFTLTEGLVSKLIAKNINPNLENTKAFLEQGDEEVKECFENAKSSAELVLKSLAKVKPAGKLETEEVYDMKVLLKIWLEMIKLDIKKIGKQPISSYELYNELFKFSPKITNILNGAFEFDLNEELACSSLLEYCFGRARLKKVQDEQYEQQEQKANEELLNLRKQIEREMAEEKQKLSERTKRVAKLKAEEIKEKTQRLEAETKERQKEQKEQEQKEALNRIKTGLAKENANAMANNAESVEQNKSAKIETKKNTIEKQTKTKTEIKADNKTDIKAETKAKNKAEIKVEKIADLQVKQTKPVAPKKPKDFNQKKKQEEEMTF